jgi:hypothetical protein
MNLNHFQVVAKFEAYILKANDWYACSLLQSTSFSWGFPNGNSENPMKSYGNGRRKQISLKY